jgi:hypothetical protein
MIYTSHLLLDLIVSRYTILLLIELEQMSTRQVSVRPYASGADALRKLIESNDNMYIVRISPRGYALRNGVNYCYVGVKSDFGMDCSVEAYGKEALELYHEAKMITMKRTLPILT